MRITLVFTRTVVTQVDCWPEYRNVTVDVPDNLAVAGTQGDWHLVGALTPEPEKAKEDLPERPCTRCWMRKECVGGCKSQEIYDSKYYPTNAELLARGEAPR